MNHEHLKNELSKIAEVAGGLGLSLAFNMNKIGFVIGTIDFIESKIDLKNNKDEWTILTPPKNKH